MHHPRVGRVVASLALLASLILDTPAAVTAGPAPALVQAGFLADASGQPIFVLGVNYEGPVDRPWRMWDNDQFDLGLIGKDLDRAKAANATTVRIFVQQALANDIRASNWDKLDRFLDLADQRGLRIILTQADYGSVNVSGLAATAGQIAAHTNGRGTILALDLKNEPHFSDLALSTYPPGAIDSPTAPTTCGSCSVGVRGCPGLSQLR